MSGANLVILAGTSHKLSRGQARDWRPHEQTQATTIPEGQNWPRVKKLPIGSTLLNHITHLYMFWLSLVPYIDIVFLGKWNYFLLQSYMWTRDTLLMKI